MALVTAIQAGLPHGFVRALAWFRRFRALGFSTGCAAKAAVSTELRVSVGVSRIEHLPRGLRRGIPFVVDAGANAGQWLFALTRLVRISQAEVFEPHPDAFRKLRASFGDRPWICLHNAALGERSGVMTLHVMRMSVFSSLAEPLPSLASRYSAHQTQEVDNIPVSVVPLDDIIAADVTVDLLKIDVQGFERRVLAGAVATLGRTRVVMVEGAFFPHYEGDDTFASLHQHLTKDLAFEFWDMAPPTRADDGRALWTDMVFVNPRLQ